MDKCKFCGSETVYKEGYNQAKKKGWKGYFCQNPECKQVEWLRGTPPKPQNSPLDGFSKILPPQPSDPIKILAEEVASINQRLGKWEEFFKKGFSDTDE